MPNGVQSTSPSFALGVLRMARFAKGVKRESEASSVASVREGVGGEGGSRRMRLPPLNGEGGPRVGVCGFAVPLFSR